MQTSAVSSSAVTRHKQLQQQTPVNLEFSFCSSGRSSVKTQTSQVKSGQVIEAPEQALANLVAWLFAKMKHPETSFSSHFLHTSTFLNLPFLDFPPSGASSEPSNAAAPQGRPSLGPSQAALFLRCPRGGLGCAPRPWRFTSPSPQPCCSLSLIPGHIGSWLDSCRATKPHFMKIDHRSHCCPVLSHLFAG